MRRGALKNNIGLEDGVRSFSQLLIIIFVFSSPTARSAEFERSAIVAAARVLAGGELDESKDGLRVTAGRLVARGAVADKHCELKDQTKVALWIMNELGVTLLENEQDKALLGLGGIFVADDFKTLGRKEWCIDYMARATAANTLFTSLIKKTKK